jgi:predicted DNA-binding transcriptional regulator AlpA
MTTLTNTRPPVPCFIADTVERPINDKPALSIAEVATLTGFSRQTITRMFEKEPGVRVIDRPETLHKRSYRSLRIPRNVYERVVRRVTI